MKTVWILDDRVEYEDHATVAIFPSKPTLAAIRAVSAAAASLSDAELSDLFKPYGGHPPEGFVFQSRGVSFGYGRSLELTERVLADPDPPR